MKYKAHWYGSEPNERQVDPQIITADSPDEATKIAYEHMNGNPPYPLLYLEEVK